MTDSLTAPCLGAPRSEPQANRRRRLLAGHPPVAETHLAKASAEGARFGLAAEAAGRHRDLRGAIVLSAYRVGCPSPASPDAHVLGDIDAPEVVPALAVLGGGSFVDGGAVGAENQDAIEGLLACQVSVGTRAVVCAAMYAALPPRRAVLPAVPHRIADRERQAAIAAITRSREAVMPRMLKSVSLPAARMRISGKQPPPHVAAAVVSGNGGLPSTCCSSPDAPWSRRVAVAAHAGKTECHVCASATLARCKSCRRPLCISCAKRRIDCRA